MGIESINNLFTHQPSSSLEGYEGVAIITGALAGSLVLAELLTPVVILLIIAWLLLFLGLRTDYGFGDNEEASNYALALGWIVIIVAILVGIGFISL